MLGSEVLESEVRACDSLDVKSALDLEVKVSVFSALLWLCAAQSGSLPRLHWRPVCARWHGKPLSGSHV